MYPQNKMTILMPKINITLSLVYTIKCWLVSALNWLMIAFLYMNTPLPPISWRIQDKCMFSRPHLASLTCDPNISTFFVLYLLPKKKR